MSAAKHQRVELPADSREKSDAAIVERLQKCADRTSALLKELLPPVAGPEGRVVEAMRHGCLNGGKRLRPFLAVATGELFGVPQSETLRTAAAIEMVHSYSLVHDDLPAMDDADLRRGEPTVHVVYDDATAILAGDGLLTEAFTVLASPETHPDSDVRVALIAGLAQASGAQGMVGGQMIDMSPDREEFDLDGITRLQALKTGALIKFSCQAGAILGRANREQYSRIDAYADDLGLAFQVVDDLLDVEGTTEALGKPAQQDAQAQKATFVGQLGVAGARQKAAHLAESAIAQLDVFGGEADPLRQVVHFVIERRS